MKARLLTRFSPRPGETRSTQQQVDLLLDWCKREGHAPIATYSDEAKSGKAPDFDTLEDLAAHRPALINLLRDLQPGEIAVAYDLRRWSRDPLLGLLIAKQVQRKRATFATTVNGVIDVGDDRQELLLYVEWWGARSERKQIQARCKTKARIKSAAGYLTGGIVPFGSVEVAPEVVDGIQRRRFEDCPVEQAALARMRELAVRGYSPPEIARQLHREGHKRRSGKRISRQLVAKKVRSG